MQDKKQQLELDTEEQTSSKFGKEYIKAVYCHSAYLTYMLPGSSPGGSREFEAGTALARRTYLFINIEI